MRNKYFKLILILCMPFISFAQINDSVSTFNSQMNFVKSNWKNNSVKKHHFIPTIILSATLITYGFTALSNYDMKKINTNAKKELQKGLVKKFKTKIDNYIQYSPAITVYALNAFGIKGKNNFRDRTMIYALSTLFSTASVLTVKKITKVSRPDRSGKSSFPSGHTTTAFAAAEFLNREYKDVSPWYGIAGYIAATTTGFFRMCNNKHWLSDIIAGAGFGILSTKLAYWLYPNIKKKLFRDKDVNTIIIPYYSEGNGGLSFVHNF